LAVEQTDLSGEEEAAEQGEVKDLNEHMLGMVSHRWKNLFRIQVITSKMHLTCWKTGFVSQQQVFIITRIKY
jgi:hypothetical protein